jgi:hypothetical protein
MATQYAFGKIVTNGLVLALDAADKNSYPGTGTTWNDLSGNSNSGSLVNTPTFNSTNGGGIVFNGTNQYGNLPITFANISSSTCIFNLSFSSVSTAVRGIMGYGNTTANYGCYVRLASSGDGIPSAGDARLQFRVLDTGVSVNNTIYGSTNITANTNYNIAFVMLPSSYKIYINGVEDTLLVFGGSNNGRWVGNGLTATPTAIALGSQFYNNAYTNYFAGTLYTTQIYNRALSVTEIQQNYNALKSRFGLI